MITRLRKLSYSDFADREIKKKEKKKERRKEGKEEKEKEKERDARFCKTCFLTLENMYSLYL